MLYETRLVRKRDISEGTVSFSVEKPQDFNFKPGQFANFIISDWKDADKKMSHYFSIVSSPLDEEISFTTRMRSSDYKESLMRIKFGDRVEIEGPLGELVLPEDEEQQVILIAGGVGITPFRSMIRDILQKESQRQITLLYADKTPERAAYFDEFIEIEPEKENIKVVMVMKDLDGTKQTERVKKGSISDETIKSVIYWKNAIYYITGSFVFVDIIENLLRRELFISSEQIKKETFVGY